MDNPNSGSYFLGIFYFDKKDKRVIVPKINKALGWTINFARPQAYLIIVLLITVAIFSGKI